MLGAHNVAERVLVFVRPVVVRVVRFVGTHAVVPNNGQPLQPKVVTPPFVAAVAYQVWLPNAVWLNENGALKLVVAVPLRPII